MDCTLTALQLYRYACAHIHIDLTTSPMCERVMRRSSSTSQEVLGKYCCVGLCTAASIVTLFVTSL